MLGIQSNELGLLLVSLPHVRFLQVKVESEGASGKQDRAAEGRRQKVIEVDGHPGAVEGNEVRVVVRMCL